MRHLGVMALLVVAVPVQSQTFVRVGGGATMGTEFVKDFIVEEVAVKQSFAPTLSLAVLHTISPGYRLGLEARYAMGDQEVRFGDTSENSAGLSTLAIAAMADGPIRSGLRWEATAGMLMYRPETEAGVFSEGAVSPLHFGAGVAWSRPMSTDMSLIISARYDFHSFRSIKVESIF